MTYGRLVRVGKSEIRIVEGRGGSMNRNLRSGSRQTSGERGAEVWRLPLRGVRLAPSGQDALDLDDVLIADPFAAAVAALEAVEDVFPHGSRRLEPAGPFAAALELPAE